MSQTFKQNTWLQDESAAYPNGGQTRKGRALFPDGKTRAIRAGIPDTFFSIPAHARINGRYVAGWVTVDDSSVDCPNLPHDGLHCDVCQFGLVDSPTRGVLVFHLNHQYAQAVAA